MTKNWKFCLKKLIKLFSKLQKNNSITQYSVIPYELNKKGIQIYKHKDDTSFYEQITQQALHVKLLDHIIYGIRPTGNLRPLAKTIIHSAI